MLFFWIELELESSAAKKDDDILFNKFYEMEFVKSWRSVLFLELDAFCWHADYLH